MLYIGLMSGTSMDGIDAGLIATDATTQIQEHGGSSITYPPEFKILLKSAEWAAKKYAGDLQLARQYFKQCIAEYTATLQLNKFNQPKDFDNITFDTVIAESTKLHNAAAQKLLTTYSLAAKDITAIGYHGQTLFHSPSNHLTIQVGDGQLLADLTGIRTINNFREPDLKLGGQGAPLAPIYHQALASHDQISTTEFQPLAVVNCGGIANITFITGSSTEDIVGFDTGPGNNLLDRLVSKKTNGSERMDTDGNYGMQGQVNQELLAKLFEQAITLPTNHNYFTLQPPKSLDSNDLHLIAELEQLSLADGCATLAAFTAQSIVTSLQHFPKTGKTPFPTTWVLAGGGWNNQKILTELTARLQNYFTGLHPAMAPKLQIVSASRYGWDAQYMEAYVFGYLAARRLNNLPTSLPNITGVSQPVSAGSIYMPATVINLKSKLPNT